METKFSQKSLRSVLEALGYSVDRDAKIHCIDPTHREATPSAHVNHQVLHCYGCKQSWNAIQVIQTVMQCTEEEAKDWYSYHLLGESVDDWKSKSYRYRPLERREPEPKPSEVKPADYANQLDRFIVASSSPERLRQATNYLKERGLDGTQEVYLAPTSYDVSWLKPLQGRLIIPYRSFDGTLMHLQGRAMDADKNKYMYHRLFGGGKQLFGLDALGEKTDTLIIAEGALTAMAINQAMRRKKSMVCIGASDKNQKPEPILEILSRYKRIKEVILCPDFDDAQEHSGLQSFILLGRELLAAVKNNAVRVSIIPSWQGEHKDALDLLKAEGERGLQAVFKTKVRVKSSDEEQYRVRDAYKLIQKIHEPDQLRELMVKALNTPYDYKQGRPLNALKNALECIVYNPMRRNYQYFKSVEKSAIVPEEYYRYKSKDGKWLVKTNYMAWRSQLKSALIEMQYTVANNQVILEVLQHDAVKKLFYRSPFDDIKVDFSIEEEADAWFGERDPLRKVLSYFKFADEEQAYHVFDVWLKHMWLTVHKMHDESLAGDDTIINHLMPIVYGKQGTGKGTLFKVLSYSPEYAGVLYDVQDLKNAVQVAMGKIAMHWDDMNPRKLDVESVKRYVTTGSIPIRLPYREEAEDIIRTDSIYASTNHISLLIDETGSRRSYPLEMLYSGISPQILSTVLPSLTAELGAYYYNLVGYELSTHGDIYAYYGALTAQKDQLFRVANERNYFAKNINYVPSIDLLDDYFNEINQYHIYGRDMIASEDWTLENHIITRLRKAKTDSCWCSKQEFVKYCEGMKIFDSNVISVAKNAFMARASHHGYDVSVRKVKNISIYQSSISIYLLPPTAVERLRGELSLSTLDAMKEEMPKSRPSASSVITASDASTRASTHRTGYILEEEDMQQPIAKRMPPIDIGGGDGYDIRRNRSDPPEKG